MTNRLDTQRRPSKAHVRTSNRKYVRGYDTIPHEIWGDTIAGGATFPATIGYAGIPGSFGPEGCTLPANAAAVVGSSIVASPSTTWTTGQYIQTATGAAAGRVYWNGSAWVGGGAAP
jgi:hypothetical protein